MNTDKAGRSAIPLSNLPSYCITTKYLFILFISEPDKPTPKLTAPYPASVFTSKADRITQEINRNILLNNQPNGPCYKAGSKQ